MPHGILIRNQMTMDVTMITAAGAYIDLTGEEGDMDSAPVWSPDGRSLVFRRSSPAAPSGQLWIMSADGGDPQPLTQDSGFGSAAPSWSPDGRFIVYQRFRLEEAYAEPQVWILDVETKETRKLIEPGAWPVWLP